MMGLKVNGIIVLLATTYSGQEYFFIVLKLFFCCLLVRMFMCINHFRIIDLKVFYYYNTSKTSSQQSKLRILCVSEYLKKRNVKIVFLTFSTFSRLSQIFQD